MPVMIHQKSYVTVNERVSEFREKYGNAFSMETEIVQMDEKSVTMKAVIKDESGRIIATGFANEEKAASNINKTSFIENCETSAWGRALANLGIGIEDSVASADEVQQAVQKQSFIGQKKQETFEEAMARPVELKKDAPVNQEPKATISQRNKLFALAKSLNISDDLLKAECQERYGVTTRSDLTSKQISELINEYEARIAN